MNLIERSYSGKIIRPKPHLVVNEEKDLIIICTSWGAPEHAEKAAEEIQKYVHSAKADVEVTSPFEFLTCLTDEVNYLRTSLLIVNDYLYRSENRTEYYAGVEALVLFKRGRQLAWAQVGGPSILIQRSGGSMQPLSVSGDFASEKQDLMGPLPQNLLGTDRSCFINVGHTTFDENDKLVLVASSILSTHLWRRSQDLDLNGITQSMIQENSENPFWLGIVQPS